MWISIRPRCATCRKLFASNGRRSRRVWNGAWPILIAINGGAACVGNDPAREPVLDEAMASWSALLYFRELYGEQKAAAVLEDQLRGVYRLYRTFGGDDMDAESAFARLSATRFSMRQS